MQPNYKTTLFAAAAIVGICATPSFADELDQALAGKVVQGRVAGAPVTGQAATSTYNDRSYRGDVYRRDDRRYDDDRRYSGDRYGRDDYRDRRYAHRDVDCISNGRYRRCDIDTPYNSITFHSRLSRYRCREGLDWGLTRGAIWVNNGCAARFTIVLDDRGHRYDRPGHAYGYNDRRYDRGYDDRGRRYGRRDRVETLSCSSISHRRSLCEIPYRVDDVRIVDRHSKASCRYGSDWGVGRRGIWVDNGCRATFAFRIDDRRDRRYGGYYH